MDKSYKITGFAGSGYNGSVFIAEFNDKDVALKIQYGARREKDALLERCKREFRNLCILSGIRGIPSPIQPLFSLSGTYEELGLASSGKSVEEVVDRSMLGFIQEDFSSELYFSGAFLFELIYGRKLGADNKQPPKFFDELEAIASQVHDRGLSLTADKLNVMESDGMPYILDWSRVIDLSTLVGTQKEEQIQQDKRRINSLRGDYQQ